MSTGPDLIETRHLFARRPQATDDVDYCQLFLDPQVHAWLQPAPLPPLSPDDPPRFLTDDQAHWAEHGFGPWTLLERAGGAYVGRAGLKWTHVAGEPAVELAWALMPTHWGRGLATEAAAAAVTWARALRIAEIVAFTLTTNHASRRVMRKAGLPEVSQIEHAGLPHVLARLRLSSTETHTATEARPSREPRP